VTKIMETV
jgi:hypothetical protein